MGSAEWCPCRGSAARGYPLPPTPKKGETTLPTVTWIELKRGLKPRGIDIPLWRPCHSHYPAGYDEEACAPPPPRFPLSWKGEWALDGFFFGLVSWIEGVWPPPLERMCSPPPGDRSMGGGCVGAWFLDTRLLSRLCSRVHLSFSTEIESPTTQTQICNSPRGECSTKARSATSTLATRR